VAIGLAFAALALPGCGGGSGGEPKVTRSVPFRIVDNRIVIDATVAGRTVPMILDSGGPTVVFARLARLIHAPSVGSERTELAGGWSSRRAVRISSLKFAGIELRDVRVPVAAPAGSALACASPYGVIGADLLDDKVVRIDFGSSRISIAGAGAGARRARSAERVPFRAASEALPVPSVAARVGSAARRLVIDTADQHYVTLRAPAGAASRGLTFIAAGADRPSVTGDVAFTRLPALRVHGLVRRNVVATSASASARPDALGIGFLRDFDVTIDWPERSIALRRSGRPGDGGFRTYGYLPERRRDAVVAAAVMRDGPAEAAGMHPGDVIASADGISLRHASRSGFCRAYAESLDPTRDLQRVEFSHGGRRIGGDVAAIDVRPRDLEAPARPPEPPAPPALSAADRTVFVDGDSLSVGARPYLERNLRGWHVSQSAMTGRSTAQGLAILRAHAANLERVLVMALGTNDDSRATQAFGDAIRETMAIAGPRRCVVWPTIVRPSFQGTSYAGLNRVLADEAAKRDNLFVVDWAETIRVRPELLTPDGVHLTPDGYAARARAIAQAVRVCR
jgi:lysophospholipase L1-like esterase